MKRLLFLLLILCGAWQASADEGMWLMGNLHRNKPLHRLMKDLGIRMTPGQLYNPKKPALANAVVSFGGFCSGVVVSEDGLVFTNHHCGFGSIQQHSSVTNDYLRDGFVARTREEELPNPELYVRFLLRTEDVTARVLSAAASARNETERQTAVDSMMHVIGGEVSKNDSTLIGIVDAYYAGNEFWLSVYRDFNDVRLVYAPPSSVGKFGWDTDNWMWPRHTGDFSVFRIYADRRNRPADYSPDNVPYRPPYVAPVSLDGYREGDFCMTIGYPGRTERYLSSFGVEEMMNTSNQAMIDVRGVKQAIWKREMNRRDDIRINYAAKYDESSNYWKNSIGTNKAIRRLKVLEKKRSAEEALREWIRTQPDRSSELIHLLSSLELDYGNRRQSVHALSYLGEAFLNGPELVQIALESLNFDFGDEEKLVSARMKRLREKYEKMDADIDREVFAAMIDEYRRHVPVRYLPAFYAEVDSLGSAQAFAEKLYANSLFTASEGRMQRFLAQDSTALSVEDPAIIVGLDLLTKFYEVSQEIAEASARIEKNERLFNDVMRRMYADRNFYPDANSTMRLSIGTIGGYSPFDGAVYDHYTTVAGILEKARKHRGDKDFELPAGLMELFTLRDYGPYGNDDGEMNVCFISNNDITGGNSGSAMFNAGGELIGLAFDGNWEAMSSDIVFEPNLQRCIGVDMRYMLFIMERHGKAEHLIRELNVRR